MKTKFYIFSVLLLLVGMGVFVWIESRQNDTPPPLSEETDEILDLATKLLKAMDYPPEKLQQLQDLRNDPHGDKLLKMTIEEIHLMPDDELRSLAEELGMSTDDLLNWGSNALSPDEMRLRVEQMSDEELKAEEMSDEEVEAAKEFVRKAKEESYKHLDRLRELETYVAELKEWEANAPQRRAEAEKRRQKTAETVETLKWIEKWKQDRRQELSRFVDLEEVDGKLEITEWNPEFLESDDRAPVSSSEESPSVITAEPPLTPERNALVPPPGSYDPVRSGAAAQLNFMPWLHTLEEDYLDVVVSQHLTPKEMRTYFPTAVDREMLTLRTAQMQKSVVSQVRKVVSDIKGATVAEKRALARELVTQNFDKDFAEAVLTELQKETE